MSVEKAQVRRRFFFSPIQKEFFNQAQNAATLLVHVYHIVEKLFDIKYNWLVVIMD
jgi:hypothetical protein